MAPAVSHFLRLFLSDNDPFDFHMESLLTDRMVWSLRAHCLFSSPSCQKRFSDGEKPFPFLVIMDVPSLPSFADAGGASYVNKKGRFA